MVKRHWFCSKFLQNFCLPCFQDAILILALWFFASDDSFLRTHSRVICIVQSLKSSLNIVRGIKVSLANIFCSFSYDSKVNVKKAIGLIITDKNTATCLRVVSFFYIYLPSLHIKLRRDFSCVTFYGGRKATSLRKQPFLLALRCWNV